MTTRASEGMENVKFNDLTYVAKDGNSAADYISLLKNLTPGTLKLGTNLNKSRSKKSINDSRISKNSKHSSSRIENSKNISHFSQLSSNGERKGKSYEQSYYY